MKNKSTNLVVAITSWKKRIGNVIAVVNSILENTLIPDKIYLTLSTDEFPNKENDLPRDLVELFNSNNRLVINWVKKNTKTMKKVFPILKYLSDDDFIINLDDDILLPKESIEYRINEFNGEPIASGNNPRWHIVYKETGMYTSSAFSLFQKKNFNHWKEFLNDEIIGTYNDDQVYAILCWLNGYKLVPCTDYSLPTGISKHKISFYNEVCSSSKNKIYTNHIIMWNEILSKRVFELTGMSIKNSFAYYRNDLKKKLFDCLEWILCDKYAVADDNCEHLYRYIRQNHTNIKLSYMLDSNSNDYKRLSDLGFNIVSTDTTQFGELIKRPHISISSELWKHVCEDLEDDNSLKVFIPHGITLGDSSRYFNKGKFDLCTSCVEKEYDSYINGKYDYKQDKDIFKLTGLPRHDSLIEKISKMKDSKDKVISFSFTYRHLKKSKKYFRLLNKLFNCDYLKKLHDEYGIKFQIMIHPFIILNNFDDSFELPDFIKDCRDISYQDFILNTDLMISDYSSVCQEFSLLGKNIIFYQFDRDEFLSDKSFHTYDKGWFDWDTDALGYICLTLNDVIDKIDEIIKRKFSVEDEYINKMNGFFKFHDTKNCERVYNEIDKLITNNVGGIINEYYDFLKDYKYIDKSSELKNKKRKMIAMSRNCFSIRKKK